MTAVVLDASAVIALLKNEPGWERVEAVLANSAISAVNLAEVVGYLARTGAEDGSLRALLYLFSIQVLPFDDTLAFDAGRLVQVTRAVGLSLGDRACLALADRLKAVAMTADRPWSRIARAVGVEVEVIR